MIEVRKQIYWGDCDPAGLLYFGTFFRVIGQVEEELYLRAATDRERLFESQGIWMPRAEIHANFLSPIRSGSVVLVRVDPQFKGDKTVRLGFEVLSEDARSVLATGYITIVCVDRVTFKARPIPEEIRRALGG